ncbi:hypothetical protein E2C01_019103 [Portunus trituberculatus]|uniref:Uncharacterized protein n=1 Tax=Portunus trituberculatus TaxID=210409 RepID=A0A5B7DY49_PORTR|nr:hypothetical protein [Portunus trituberculatus]
MGSSLQCSASGHQPIRTLSSDDMMLSVNGRTVAFINYQFLWCWCPIETQKGCSQLFCCKAPSSFFVPLNGEANQPSCFIIVPTMRREGLAMGPAWFSILALSALGVIISFITTRSE